MERWIDRGDGVWQVKLPLPFPLQWVNAYVVRDRGEVDVIDPGLHTKEAVAVWEAAAEAIGFGWRDVRSVALTHHHPDHYGLAGWMQERSGAPVRMSRAAREHAETLWGERADAAASATLSLFERHGFPATDAAAMRAHLDGFVPLVSPQPAEISLLEAGERVRLGAREYVALDTPGHAAGHLSFWDEAAGRLFCGDHVLPGITPNVSLLPFGDADPLGTFLASLEDAGRLPVREAFPGHREPFGHYAERARAIAAHHHERLSRMESLTAEPATAYAVCRAMFGDKLSTHQLRFALSETIAHLVYLERRGRVAGIEDAGVVRYVAR